MCAQPRQPETSRSESPPSTASQAQNQPIQAPQPRTPNFVVNNEADVRRMLGSLGIANPGNITVLNSGAALANARGALAGTPAAGLLSQPPPIVVQVPDATLAMVTRGRDAFGYYMPNSNMILVSASASATPERLNEVLCHEMSHYAAWRGHGFENVWTINGQMAAFNKPVWMEEGMANAISSSIIPSTRERMAYPYETMAVVMLENLAGQQAVRQAYISGDYRALQQAVDSKLGAGTFERLAQFPNGAEASIFLLDAVNKNPPPINMDSYFNDPRVVRAMAALMPSQGQSQPPQGRERENADLMKGRF